MRWLSRNQEDGMSLTVLLLCFSPVVQLYLELFYHCWPVLTPAIQVPAQVCESRRGRAARPGKWRHCRNSQQYRPVRREVAAVWIPQVQTPECYH